MNTQMVAGACPGARAPSKVWPSPVLASRPWRGEGPACYLPYMLPKRLVLVGAAVLLVGAAYLARQVSRGPREAPMQQEAVPVAVGERTTPAPVPAPSPAGAGEPQAQPPTSAAPARAATITSSAAGGPEDVAPPAPSLAAQVAASSNLSLDEANRLYDRAEYEEARALALAVLREQPTSVRMRRIVVSASCIMGDSQTAQTHYLLLPTTDRADMQRRCARYGTAFVE